MHYSKLLIASAFLQGGLAAKLLTYSGRDCTGDVEEVHVYDNSCVDYVARFQSYKENGWGAKGQRVGFYDEPDCKLSALLYDTWAYDGDYFHSHQCYNIDGNSANGEDIAVSVSSYFGLVSPHNAPRDPHPDGTPATLRNGRVMVCGVEGQDAAGKHGHKQRKGDFGNVTLVECRKSRSI